MSTKLICCSVANFIDCPVLDNELTHKIIGCAIELHRAIGPGLLEKAYEIALEHDLKEMGLKVDRQVMMPFKYKNIVLNSGYRLDLVVENRIIVEIKAVNDLAPVHIAQTLTYLKLSGLPLALLINFNETVLKNGIHRLVSSRNK